MEAPTKNVPFNHVKKKIEMGLVKLRGLREEVFVAVEIHNMKLLGGKGRVKARAKNRMLESTRWQNMRRIRMDRA